MHAREEPFADPLTAAAELELYHRQAVEVQELRQRQLERDGRIYDPILKRAIVADAPRKGMDVPCKGCGLTRTEAPGAWHRRSGMHARCWVKLPPEHPDA